jgi:hypothetical protein
MSRTLFYYIYTSKEKIMLKKIFKIMGFYSPLIITLFAPPFQDQIKAKIAEAIMLKSTKVLLAEFRSLFYSQMQM